MRLSPLPSPRLFIPRRRGLFGDGCARAGNTSRTFMDTLNAADRWAVLLEITHIRNRGFAWRLSGRCGKAQALALERGFLAPHPQDSRRLVTTREGLAALREAEAAFPPAKNCGGRRRAAA
jgi:hypothetical protein